MAMTLRIKQGDTVQMLSGKDRGKQGRVLEARPRDNKVIVENLNLMRRHTKPRPMRDASRMGGKQIDAALEELTIIAGQRAQVRRARKSIAQFKIREGMPIGVRVTLRGDRMWEFLDRLVSIALPRIRDFRGLNPDSFDGRGNYSLGIREQIIFPEINYDSINQIRGLDVAITTTATNDVQARSLLD